MGIRARQVQRGFGEHRNRQHKREKEKEKLQEKDDTRFPLASVYAQDNEQLGQLSRSDGTELSPFLFGRLLSTDVGGFLFFDCWRWQAGARSKVVVTWLFPVILKYIFKEAFLN
jgi:hypothetical protein